MKVTHKINLKKSEVKNKLIDAIRYLTGTAPGMFHGYQMYYALKNFELRQKDPIADLEKQYGLYVFLDQYFDQMQLCSAQGLLKKSPEIFNNNYYKYINIILILGKPFADIDVEIGEDETTYSYDCDVRSSLSSTAIDFTQEVETLFFKHVNFNYDKEFYFDYQKVLLYFLRNSTKDYLSEDEFNTVEQDVLNTLQTDKFNKTVIKVIHDEAVQERRQFFYRSLFEWLIKDDSSSIWPLVILNFLDFIKLGKINDPNKTFIENYIHFLTNVLYSPNEKVFKINDYGMFNNGDKDYQENAIKITNMTASQCFTYENVISSLQVACISKMIIMDIPLVPAKYHNHLDIQFGKGKVDLAFDESYEDLAELYDEASLDSEKKVRSKIMQFYIDVAQEHEYKHLSYARNAIEITTKKQAFIKYLRPSFQMQNDDFIPI